MLKGEGSISQLFSQSGLPHICGQARNDVWSGRVWRETERVVYSETCVSELIKCLQRQTLTDYVLF